MAAHSNVVKKFESDYLRTAQNRVNSGRVEIREVNEAEEDGAP